MSQWQEIVELGKRVFLPWIIRFNEGATGGSLWKPWIAILSSSKANASYPNQPGVVAQLFGGSRFERYEPLSENERAYIVLTCNAAPDMAARLLEGEKLAAKYQSLSAECKSKANGLVVGQDWMRLRTKAEVYAIVARELLALLTEPTK